MVVLWDVQRTSCIPDVERQLISLSHLDQSLLLDCVNTKASGDQSGQEEVLASALMEYLPCLLKHSFLWNLKLPCQ